MVEILLAGANAAIFQRIKEEAKCSQTQEKINYL